jgi:hypothetical protein
LRTARGMPAGKAPAGTTEFTRLPFGSRPLERYADPRRLEVVDRIFLDNGHTDFERDFQVVGRFHAGLTGFRSAKIDADIVARIERQKPAAGQINVQCRAICGSLILRADGSPAKLIA